MHYMVWPSPVLGMVYAAYTETGVAYLTWQAPDEATFVQQATDYFRGPLRRLDRASIATEFANCLAGKPYTLAADLSRLSPFAQAVLQETCRIPRGEVCSYQAIAKAIGRPRAYRAVGSALARNPVPILIPCHRVVLASGELGHYSGGGPQVKQYLLRLEQEGIDCA